MDFGSLIAAGLLIGVAVFFVSRLRKRLWPTKRDVLPAMESGACGVGIVAGFHLVYCGIFPSELVHLVDPRGGHIKLSELFLEVGGMIQPANVHMDLDILHMGHIMLGGIATAVIAFGCLVQFCREPTRAAVLIDRPPRLPGPTDPGEDG
jgi:hypothetical protein